MADYDSDILEWSERQAALLRRRAAGELVNDAELDWPNIAEEIDDVAPTPVPGECPVTLDELLALPPDEPTE